MLPLPEGHRFPMEKYALLRRRVEESGLVAPGDLRVPPPATDDDLMRVHTRAYVRKVRRGELVAGEVRRIGFPWSAELVERSRRSVGGTLAAARSALEEGTGANLAGGTHHAHPDRGEGFCVFNDVAVAVRTLQAEGRVGRAAVLDLDVHQGNGTARIFAHDPRVVTLSVHGAHNFPFTKDRSDVDVELPDGTGDEAYLEAAEAGVREALGRARPDLAFYVAGADPYREDRLGRLDLSMEGLEARDRLVFDLCQAAAVPVAVVMSGGYARDVRDTVAIHFATVREAAARSRPRVPS